LPKTTPHARLSHDVGGPLRFSPPASPSPPKAARLRTTYFPRWPSRPARMRSEYIIKLVAEGPSALTGQRLDATWGATAPGSASPVLTHTHNVLPISCAVYLSIYHPTRAIATPVFSRITLHARFRRTPDLVRDLDLATGDRESKAALNQNELHSLFRDGSSGPLLGSFGRLPPKENRLRAYRDIGRR